MSFENNIFRAPVFLHKTEKTDFLVVRRGGKYFIRQVPDLFIVGQTMPKV
jgi:transcription initiation factor TFIID subunit 1